MSSTQDAVNVFYIFMLNSNIYNYEHGWKEADRESEAFQKQRMWLCILSMLSVLMPVVFICVRANWFLASSHIEPASSASDALPGDNEKATSLSFLVHHKTGTHLADVIQDALNLEGWDFHKDTHFPEGKNRDDLHWSWPVSRLFEHLFYNGTMKVVHFVRDPLDLLVSAYNYHMAGSELWLLYGDSNLWRGCPKHTHVLVDCLRSLKKNEGLVAQTRNMMREIREMFKAVQVFSRWPERALNICIWDFKRDLEIAITKICDFLGHRMCDVELVVKSIVNACYLGYCNSISWSERSETECRPTKRLGTCTQRDDDQHYRNLGVCVANWETKNLWQGNLSCCILEKPYVVECYKKPEFEKATRRDIREALEGTEMLRELEYLSEAMNCRLPTDVKPNMNAYKFYVDDDLIQAVEDFLQISEGETEDLLMEELKSEFPDIPTNFIEKIRLPGGLKIGDRFRKPVIRWLKKKSKLKIRRAWKA